MEWLLRIAKSKLGLSRKVVKLVKEIEPRTKGELGGAIYLASKLLGERLTQEQIARVLGTTSVTIRRNYYKLLREKRAKLSQYAEQSHVFLKPRAR